MSEMLTAQEREAAVLVLLDAGLRYDARTALHSLVASDADREQRIAELETTLRPFAAIWANAIQPSDPDDKIVYQHAFIEPLRVADVRRALALLKEEP